MESISLRQNIPFRQKIVMASGLFISGIIAIDNNNLLGVSLLILGLIAFSVNYNLVITKDFSNYYQIRILSLSVFKIKKKLFFPDYISLFNQSFVQSNHIGFEPDILGDSQYKSYTIKFFKETKNEILFISSKKSKVEKLGLDLAKMLEVELHNTIK